MVAMESILSVVATIISSIALIGVAAGLILQARQLKATQIQVMRAMHVELMKTGIENPAVVASVYEDTSAEDFPRIAFLNFTMTLWQTSYSLKTTTKEGVAFQAANLFASEHARNWWMGARDYYRVEAVMKNEKEFFSIVDGTFCGVLQTMQTVGQADASLSSGEE
jgi:hypothetical protein